MPAAVNLPTSPADELRELIVLLADLGRFCVDAGRDDLAQRLADRESLVAAPSTYVVIAGDYKAGKSTLVNALVGRDLCPVDDDAATAVPTLVRYSEEPTVVVRSSGADGELETTTVEIDEVAALVSESGNPGNHRGIRAVEVGIPSPLLHGGLVLVDTPGVGGLGSQYAAATVASLSMAHAVLFVSDATQEYTATELDFLGAARQACPAVMPVLTKVDLFPDWAVVLANDEAWLRRSDFGPGIVAVSAELWLRGQRSERVDLRAESGLSALVDRLAGLGAEGRTLMAAAAAADVRAVTGQLAAPLRAERDALTDPGTALRDVAAAEALARGVAGDDAGWVTLLERGIGELEGEIDRYLSQRLHAVGTDAGATVMATDPASNWEEFEARLARDVSVEVSSAARLIGDGADRLAAQLSASFDTKEAAIAPALPRRADAPVPAPVPDVGLAGGLQLRGRLLAAGWDVVEVTERARRQPHAHLDQSLFNPLSLVAGALAGARSQRRARQEELEARRRRAVEAIESYVGDARREAVREWQATLHRVHDDFRSSYQERADALYRSARESLDAARRGAGTQQSDHDAATARTTVDLDRLARFDERAGQLARALAGAPAGGGDVG